ncbi:lipid outer membrane transport protein FadL-like protein [Psychroflexus montanilacus]|uniref:lipid outer membrane transport protein FadL-like protein n=1 Tax=Psychroflexus montanilacus TaxID=2873598 RepID=UPI001CCD3A57|nr:lipid outer membrane transport protein FadL-like protein [Psychroflexus montanilacus]MBZ9652164.1 lipid outer membrane transport protein FadL-like protein [Psychroflexus montanilacus]
MFTRFILLVSILLFTSSSLLAQQGSLSPYSFLGIGTKGFRGTVENRAMGGLASIGDSIHLNLRNPAAYADLKLTAFTAGATYNSVELESDQNSDNLNYLTLDYIAIGLPFNNLGVGFGVKPKSAVGYELEQSSSTQISRFDGRGGLNTVYFSVGFEPIKNLRLGATANYNFGDIENKAIVFNEGVQFASREINFTDINGFSFDAGALYDLKLTNQLTLKSSARYETGSSLSVNRRRELATIQLGQNETENVINQIDVEPLDTEIDLPEMYAFGLGLGEDKKWFVGLEYENYQAGDFSALAFNFGPEVVQKESNTFKLGGFYVPRYNDPVSYFKRVVYRAGIRYEESGLEYQGEDINEFGISFGLGLPAGRVFTNANLGVEYFERGTTSNNLIQENFISVFLSFSFNDKWFIKSKYN